MMRLKALWPGGQRGWNAAW